VGRILGIVLIVGGIVVALILALFMFVLRTDEATSSSGAVLGFAIGTVVLVLPQFGVGAYLFWKGSQEATARAEAGKQRALLNLVKTRGQVAISDLVIDLKASKDEVHHMLGELVGMGLFAGYVNWDEGMLYSEQASELRQLSHCRHCNGELELAGKGIVRCPFCGTEYYLD
jgi:hypothetical protein